MPYVYIVMEHEFGHAIDLYAYANHTDAVEHFRSTAKLWKWFPVTDFKKDSYFKVAEEFECRIYKELLTEDF